ncbi:MAG: hypothetical protein A4E37_02234 [Methanoregulaceae archaeon PtaB.Bin056]|nr:MAG: hypothetical protein A4E37_02234 [Methanoregulaceae archaeon PtaB.Bin056]
MDYTEVDTMQRAGYLGRDGKKVLDADGIPREILELNIYGARLCMLTDDLFAALKNGNSACIWRIKQNWMEYLGGQAGRAQVSRSGRALNIELVNGDRYTLSLDSLREVLGYRERVAQIVELPTLSIQESTRDHLITDYCRPLSQFNVPETADRMTA